VSSQGGNLAIGRSPGAVDAEYDQATLEGLRSVAAGVLLVAALFVPIDLASVARPLAPGAAFHDLAIAAVAGLLWWAVDSRRLRAPLAAPAAILLAMLVISNVLRDRNIAPDLGALPIAIVLIGIGTFVLRRSWMALGVALVCGICALPAMGLGGHAHLAERGFDFLAGLAVALPMHAARRRSHRRIFALRRYHDQQRVELHLALAEAEQARRTLDEKVAERTDELSRTAEELRAQLAERQRADAERLALQARLEHDALHDALTGLANRVLFLDRLGHACHRARRDSTFRFAVLYLDLDRFKVINDTFGHDIGDQLLIGVGQRLSKCVRPSDTVARLGGDEYAVLIEGFKNAGETVAIAERIQTSIREPFSIGMHELYATASIGIADGVADARPEQYVRDADVAMYAAKSRGNRYERFDGAMHSPALARMRIETELRAAIDRGQFFVVYQPIVDLRTTRIEGFEALVRWQHPTRGVVGPDEFIPVAEETRLILPLTLAVMRDACRTAAGWRRRFQGGGPLIGVNLAAQLLTRPEMASEILQVLAETGLSASDLAIEITESAVMASPQIAAGLLSELRAKGVQVFVDDFGTGYSSLAYLTNLPVDRLKIDRTFVAAMEDPSRLRIVRTIATLAHDLGKPLVAEGIERPDQLERLRAMGCEFGQGWLFSRPMDAAQAAALLEANEDGRAFPGLVEAPEEPELAEPEPSEV
jgi:diguanylate cyclase (GGDEF)-like protein